MGKAQRLRSAVDRLRVQARNRINRYTSDESRASEASSVTSETENEVPFLQTARHHVSNVKRAGERHATNVKRFGSKHATRLAGLQRQYTQRGREVIDHVRTVGFKGIDHIRREPLCLKFLLATYHEYGLKHVMLVGIFVLYVLCGAMVFAIIEQPHEEKLKYQWQIGMDFQRAAYVKGLMGEIFNNSRYLAFLPGWASNGINKHLQSSLEFYERKVGVRFGDMKMDWDFWGAVLYTGSIATTIGYGHIYPRTTEGKVLTMIYAIGGIPLVLLLLQDMGYLLTVGLKYPWFQMKRLFRRVVSYCTKQSMKEIRRIETKERNELSVFDLPVPVAISVVVGWVFVCVITFSIFNTSWSMLEAFYFFFISLSTIGLGDLVPNQPRLLIMMFGYIIVGLSLVSMVVNLMQIKMQHTYDVGRSRLQSLVAFGSVPTTLGVFRTTSASDFDELDMLTNTNGDDDTTNNVVTTATRYTQTNLSLPTMRQIIVTSEGIRWAGSWDCDHSTKSPDEVTQLVESDIDMQLIGQMGERDSTQGLDFDSISVLSLPRSEAYFAIAETDSQDDQPTTVL